jgi:predicted GNAT family acetyltransferase
VRYFLAHSEGAPRAYLSAWDGIDGMGQVENLYTHTEYRHRGLARALIAHCVADCRARGAGPVLIVADPTDTPMRMYSAMGFRPVALKREWRRDA